MPFRSLIALLPLLVVRSAIAESPAVLPGTDSLELDRPLDEVMVEGINRFALREIEASVERRQRHWKRDYSSREAYEKSMEPNRRRLRTYLGVVDERETAKGFVPISDGRDVDGLLYVDVEWPVLRGVTGRGAIIAPDDEEDHVAFVVAVPDAGWSPGQFARAEDGLPQRLQIARRLAKSGCVVLVPWIVDRDDEFSGSEEVVFTNQPHREWVYRPAFQMGRHVVGYELQSILAAIDAGMAGHDGKRGRPIGIAGIGEGGRLALFAAALDRRIDATLVSGAFGPREDVWREPIDRNVWRLLDEFGDAEVASLVAPRPLVVEAAAATKYREPSLPTAGRRGGAAPGSITVPALADVRREYERAKGPYARLMSSGQLHLVAGETGQGQPGSTEALAAFLRLLTPKARLPENDDKSGGEVTGSTTGRHSALRRQLVHELVEHANGLMEDSDRVRYAFWKNADRDRSKKYTPEEWEAFAESYRDHVHDKMIGRLPEPTMPVNPRSRLVIDEPTHVGYEIVLDVYPDVIAGGILLVPKDSKEGERRPVVVCQHGLEGRSIDTITTDETSRAWRAYKGFATQLVKRGFVVYAPQNPYRGGDAFRSIQRKSNPLGRSLFSYIVRQHERTLAWLATQPFVDADRIAFYGLSYGGKTAMRVPALLPPREGRPGYCLSICSADFNEWVRKCVTNKARYSYVFTGEYEMFEWNMGHVANYSELAMLISPRPFMVERGHDDGVAPDEWVAWEFAKVRRHYAKLGISERAEIEWFNGPHTINGQGTFRFLHRHLDWPEPEVKK